MVGHMDGKGDKARKMDLSLRRAEAVRDYLVKQGVAAERVTAYGVGADEPIADNGSKKGRAENRRIEFRRTGP